MATLADKNVGDIVKIKENGVAVNYLIVHKGKPSDLYDDSCNGVWLLRESLHSEQAWHGTNNSTSVNDYENSDIKAWLNGTFLNTINEKIRAAIKTVKIPYRKGSGTSMEIQSGANGLSCKAFLLSGYEVGFTQNNDRNLPIDGAKLSYFSDNNSRIAKDSTNTVNTWWLRSPYTGDATIVWGVNNSGADYNGRSDYSQGVRPAFVMPFETSIDSDGIIIVQEQGTLGELNVGDIIPIKENGVKQKYIIVHKGKPSDLYDDSCDGVWLLRESIHSNIVWDGTSSSYNNDYENSDIKIWLNNTFLNTIDEKIREAIKTVKIPFKKGVGNASTGVQSGTDGLSCKVFLLSGYEVGWTTSDSQYFPIDGAKLDYFSDNASRIANLNGIPATWWLRSPYANSAKNAWNVFSNGAISHDRTWNSKGVRPALILPSSLSLSTFNSTPTIMSDKSGDLGTIDGGFTCTYSVDDADAEDNVTVSLKMDDNEISSFSAVKQQNETYTLEGNDWLKTTNGEHTFTISASDGMNTTIHAITFTRNLTELTVTLAQPLPADDVISACALNVDGSIPADAIRKFEVTNNALDTEPVWEDCTKKSQSGFSYAFTNKTAENGFAFNFRVTISRGASGSGGYITSVSGGFE